jgi:hypothetical protein
MRGLGEVLVASVQTDWMNLADVGVMLGDVPAHGGGARAQELIAAASAGNLETAGKVVDLYAIVSRESLARYLVAHGRQTDRCGIAWNWATNVVARAGFSTSALRHAAQAGATEGALVHFSVRITAGAPVGQGTRPFSGIAYGGGVITDHPVYDRVAFDIGTTKLETPAPLLFDHKQPIGVITKASLGSNIAIEGTVFADLAGPAAEVAAMADRGLPWQMSVGIFPGSVETIDGATSVALNGKDVPGPLTVYRNNRVREVSIVPLGADSMATVRVH